MVAIDGSDKKLNKKTLTFCEPSSKGAITYSPPLPIPNREVKPYHADGTAKAGE